LTRFRLVFHFPLFSFQLLSGPRFIPWLSIWNYDTVYPTSLLIGVLPIWVPLFFMVG